MTRADMTAAINHVLEVIGGNGLSGIRGTADTLHDILVNAGAFPIALLIDDRLAVVANLRRQGLIEVSQDGDGLRVQPSVKGIHRLQRAQVAGLKIMSPTRWDGLWRMVSYDIPARHGKQRRLFVAELHRLGFTMLGDSLWFHPYPCVDVLSSLIAYCGLSDYVLVAEVARLDENSSRRLHRAYPNLQR